MPRMRPPGGGPRTDRTLNPEEAAFAAELEERVSPEDIPRATVDALNLLLHEGQYPEAAALCRRYGAPEPVTYTLIGHHARHARLD